MNLLLLLSAMLTALSGAGLGVRTPAAPVAVNSVAAVTASTHAVAVAPAGRPAGAVPPLTTIVAALTLARWRLAPAAPLYLSRRRE